MKNLDWIKAEEIISHEYIAYALEKDNALECNHCFRKFRESSGRLCLSIENGILLDRICIYCQEKYGLINKEGLKDKLRFIKDELKFLKWADYEIRKEEKR